MKGIVFTEFLDMVEQEFGYEVVDHIIEHSDLPSKGIYTSIGTYHHSEIVALLTNLSKKTELDPQALLKSFGGYLFDTFLKQYPQFFEAHGHAFQFLESIDNHIHVEVKKLYPEATLPKFETETSEGGDLVMTYTSERKMASLALGLIEKSMAHYGHKSSIDMQRIEEDGSVVKFTISCS